jgi:hypothetical protein
MGLLDFLKKPKSSDRDYGMELPPVPSMDDISLISGFPELRRDNPPKLPETELPPLPTQTFETFTQSEQQPQIIERPRPIIEEPPHDLLPEMPEPPDLPTQERMMQSLQIIQKKPMLPIKMNKPSKPEFPVIQKEDIIPDKIPPLENIPEPPVFRAEKERSKKEFSELMRERPMMKTFLRPEPEKPKTREQRGPLFVKTDNFRKIIEDIEEIKIKFKSEEETFVKFIGLKEKQDKKFEEFRDQLEDVQRKLLFIDRSVFET